MPVVKGGKFVILGGASQIGSYIGGQLLDAGAAEVVLLDNLSLGSLDSIEDLLTDPRCFFVRGDVLRLNELVDAFAGAHGVFAVAGIMATSIGQNPWNGIDVNVRGVQNILEACRYQKVRKVVFSSSVGVYGSLDDQRVDEDAPLRWQAVPPPMALYCASKIMGEALARLYQQQHGLDYVALRYSAVYGERQHGRALMGKKIADLCQRARAGEPLLLDGDGEQRQDYIFAGDAARANLMAMESAVSGEAVNICAGVDTTDNRIAAIVAAACNTPLNISYRASVSGQAPTPPARKGYSVDRAQRLLGWAPQVSIEEGIGRVLRWTDQQNSITPAIP